MSLIFGLVSLQQWLLHTLPVNLLSFKAQKKNNDVELFWSTAAETGHDHFELERSKDGIVFSNIAMVPADLTTNSMKNYVATDAGALQLAVSKLYYRLKIISRTGSYEYSSVIQVPLSGNRYEMTWKMSPNPFRDRIAVHVYLPENNVLELSLYSISGALIRKKIIPAEKGYSTVELTGLDHLLSGTYFIQLKKEGQLLSEKIIKAGQQ